MYTNLIYIYMYTRNHGGYPHTHTHTHIHIHTSLIDDQGRDFRFFFYLHSPAKSCNRRPDRATFSETIQSIRFVVRRNARSWSDDFFDRPSPMFLFRWLLHWAVITRSIREVSILDRYSRWKRRCRPVRFVRRRGNPLV